MARKGKQLVVQPDWTTFKGKFFHDFDEEGYVRHQGQIIELMNNEIAIVRYFDWIMGQPSTVRAVWINDIVQGAWALYPSAELMKDAYEGYHVKRKQT